MSTTPRCSRGSSRGRAHRAARVAFLQDERRWGSYEQRMIAKGTFEIQMHAEPPYDVVEGVTLARVRFDKKFSGALEATSTVHMIGARTSVDGSAGYVAIERVTGALEGRSGTFVLQHSGVLTRGSPALSVTVVPDSATGELAGMSGRMEIQVVAGQHHYVLEYQLER